MDKSTQQSLDITCVVKPSSLGAVLAQLYPDFPLAQMPGVAVRALARRWQDRVDVVYIEARDTADRFMGYVFAQSYSEQPWRVLLRQPAWAFGCA